MFADTAALKAAMDTALKEHPDKPVVLDFYADWCISCKEMAVYTLNQPEVHQAVDMERFFQIDVTANTPEHQALLKEYGLFERRACLSSAPTAAAASRCWVLSKQTSLSSGMNKTADSDVSNAV